MNSQAIRQSIAYHQDHRIDENEAVVFGFRDAGRGTGFDENGKALSRPYREIMLVRPPEEDVAFAEALETARSATAGLNSFQAVDYLNDYVGRLLSVNDPEKNAQLIDQLAGDHGIAGAEISLGQLIMAGTGVCRHRSLLFKVFADQLGLRAAVVRGNYIRRGADRGHADGNLIGGHAWNEVIFENGERLLVDTMHNFVAELTDPLIEGYSDVHSKPLYPLSREAETAVNVTNDSYGWPKSGLATIRKIEWVWVASPAGGRSAYAYLDAMPEPDQQRLRHALRSCAVRYDRYETSFGSNLGRRPVLRVRGVAQVLLKRMAGGQNRPAPTPLKRA